MFGTSVLSEKDYTPESFEMFPRVASLKHKSSLTKKERHLLRQKSSKVFSTYKICIIKAHVKELQPKQASMEISSTAYQK